MHKKTIIKKINSIIKEFGDFTTADVSAESSPNLSNVKGINNLCESFQFGKAEVVSYDRNDEEIDSELINYECMHKDVLEEIHILAENWEAECLQFEGRQGK
jgi:hypothetical protein